MSRMPRWIALLPLALTLGEASAAVRRCLAEDGTTIFTDRACEHFGAREVVVAPAAPTEAPAEAATTGDADADAHSAVTEPPLSSYGPVASDCARTPDALVTTLRQLLETRDVNGLAGLYHWHGMGKGGARAVMDRLESLAAQSDGSVELVYPEAAFVVLDPDAYPGIPPEDPEAVRIGAFQAGSLSDPAPPLATLGVVRQAGCWWLRF